MGRQSPLETGFRERIKQQRDIRGWSQADLSKLLQRRGLEHIYPTTVAKIESGERAVRIDEAAALADLFDVSIDALLGRDIRHGSNLAYTLRAVLSVARQSAQKTIAIADALAASRVDLDALEFNGRDALESEVTGALQALDTAQAALAKVAEFRLPGGFKVTLRKGLVMPETRTVVVPPRAGDEAQS
jgi:transcriptional regulator with XRE-family HTH domain